MANQELILTSVKIPSNLWDEFKVAIIRYKFSFHKLANRTIHLYLTDSEFRKKIHNYNDLSLETEE
jgi:hypothetical protein